MSKPIFARRSDGTIAALTGAGAKHLNQAQWATWTNLGYATEPGMGAMDPGPFADVVATYGGWMHENINTLAVAIATELAARLGGPNGHIMSDGDISRFADATADEVILRLQQGGVA